GVTAGLGEPGRALVRRGIDEAPVLSFDVNYRQALWTPAEARRFIEPILPRVRYLFMGQEEAATVFGLAGEPQATLEALAGRASDGRYRAVAVRLSAPAARGPRSIVAVAWRAGSSMV